MPISYTHKCVFIHIPKTGGTTVEQLFNMIPDLELDFLTYYSTDARLKCYIEKFDKRVDFCLQHLPSIFVRDLNPEIFSSFFKFALVRNPYDRAISEFCWQNKDIYEQEETDRYYFIENFKAWVNELPTKMFIDHKLPQYYFLYDNKDNLLVDKIYKYENMQNALKELSAKFNFEIKDICLNKSTLSVDKNILLTPKVKEKIYSVYAKDFELFGYEK